MALSTCFRASIGTLAGIHQPYLSGVENGTRNPTITVLKKLADALGVPPAALLE